MKAGDTVRLTRGPYSQERVTVLRTLEDVAGLWCIVKLENGFEYTVHANYVEREEGATVKAS